MDYKKILEGVVDIINTTEKSDIGFANICAYIGENFPELRESEDEQHRKWVLEYLYDGLRKSDEQFKGQFKAAIAWLEKQGEQNLAWSKEDEYYYGVIQYILNNECVGKTDKENAIKWLKSLKDRYVLQPKQEWSEEDESRITTICTYLQDYARLSGSESRTIRINEYCDWLKSLKDRCLPQQQHEWSEEDECNMRRIIRVLEDNDSDWDALTAWLKSLNPQSRWKPSEQEKAALRTAIQVMTKERCFPLLGAHLQNILDAFEGESRVDWKPSKGQMEALKEACNEHYNPKGELYSLYEQLKHKSEL